jgi:beta-lactamase class A
MNNRRAFLTSVVGATASAAITTPLAAREVGHRRNFDRCGLAQNILDLFEDLPGQKAVKVWAPAMDGRSEIIAQINQHQRMFTASTNKALILCERLRQLDSATVGEKIANHELALNKDVFSPGSPIFNPPNLTGLMSERTAMEAMILHSDNTATDMVLRETGPAKVRKFIASLCLRETAIPASTRAFAAYLLGAPNYLTISWDELLEIASSPLVHPLLNDVETLASSPADLVSFFSQALQGQFFLHPQTLTEFRRLLSLGDINYLVRFPLGVLGFGKAGYADMPGFHARSIAGGLYFSKRWAYFSFVLNWETPEEHDLETVEAFYSAIRQTAAYLQEHAQRSWE